MQLANILVTGKSSERIVLCGPKREVLMATIPRTVVERVLRIKLKATHAHGVLGVGGRWVHVHFDEFCDCVSQLTGLMLTVCQHSRRMHV